MKDSSVCENVVIISLDCVRPEALGCYPQRFPLQIGRSRKARTPNLDSVAAEGCRFDQAITPAPYTPAAHASLLTGLYPPRHGIRALRGYRLVPDVATLAEIAHADGYRTAAFIGADALSRHYGLQRGFDLYDDVYDRQVRNADLGYRRFGDEITHKAIDWLAKNALGDPFFLFLHYFDAHSIPMEVAMALDRSPLTQLIDRLHRDLPESAPRLYKKLVKRLYHRHVRTKRAGLAYHLRNVVEIDRYIGKLLAYLRTSGLYNRTMIVITADHGDAFGEHGEKGHRRFLYDTTLKVPLIVKAGPRFAGRFVPDLVRLVDIMPTVCEMMADLTSPQTLDGISLVPLMLGSSADLSAYSETRFDRLDEQGYHLIHHFNSMRTGRWKLILDRLAGGVQLFDLEGDPYELVDVSSRHPDVVAALREDLEQTTGESTAGGCAETVAMEDSELAAMEERLRALGYL